MELLSSQNIQDYLESTHFIDWKSPAILEQVKRISQELSQPEQIAKACFLFVRDEIKHSWDHQLNPVTCRASDVLTHKTGFCYAKSHLLAALLRANGIPAGLCYQRLTISNDQPPFCLHGLNAIYLPDHGWYRVDARGNKPGVDAQFCPPTEQLAFPIISEGEQDFATIYAEPLPLITELLESAASYQEVAERLPDAVTLNNHRPYDA